MADTVRTLDIFKGNDLLIRNITNISDGTGETSVIKVAKSALVNSQGQAPTKLAIEELWWSISGFSSVRLFWNHTSPDLIAVLAAGNGVRAYSGLRGVSSQLPEPVTTGTGDIILTTAGALANATYDIQIVLRMA